MNHIPEVSPPTKECTEPKLWHCYDVQTAEIEVLEFMAQLVRTLKPHLVVETGTYRGLSACYMARALKANGRGKVITCEVDPTLHGKAKALGEKLGILDVAEFRLESSLETKVDGPIGILFSDSLPELRVKEIERFWDQLSPSSVIVVHDVNSGSHKPLRTQILELDSSRMLSVVLLPVPRGLAIAQKLEGRE